MDAREQSEIAVGSVVAGSSAQHRGEFGRYTNRSRRHDLAEEFVEVAFQRGKIFSKIDGALEQRIDDMRVALSSYNGLALIFIRGTGEAGFCVNREGTC